MKYKNQTLDDAVNNGSNKLNMIIGRYVGHVYENLADVSR